MSDPARIPPLDLAEAQRRIVDAVSPIRESESVGLADALHRVLAGAVHADVDVPGADNASMDGYAYAARDVSEPETRLRVIGESFAGHAFPGRLGPGEAVRIMTGAVIPDGADTVVMQENTSATAAGSVVIERPPASGANVRPAGEDLRRGARVLAAGHYLRPADIALLASVGAGEVSVIRRPRVAFFSTGDELRSLGSPIAPGEIYDSNRHGLAALLAELGVEAVDLGIVRDRRDALETAFNRASGCDALVTSGGVSVGAADFVLDVLHDRGRVDFWRVAVKPGKPLAFGQIDNLRFFGLPGNPVSTAVTFIQLVRPALVRLAGGWPAPPIRFPLPTATALCKRPGRTHFLRAVMQLDAPTPQVRALDHQGSGVMRSMSEADAFIVLPADRQDIPAGTPVVVEPFAQTIWASPEARA